MKEAPYDIVADRHVGGWRKDKTLRGFGKFSKSSLFFALESSRVDC